MITRESIPREKLMEAANEGSTNPTAESDYEPSKTQIASSGKRLCLEKYLSDHGIEYREKDEPTSDGRTVYLLDQCPFNAEHGSRGESCVMQEQSGKLSFKCQHDSCSAFGWRDFKEAIGQPAADQFHGQNESPSGTRIEIILSNDEHAVNRGVIRALEQDPSLFQRGSELVRVVTDARPKGEIQRAAGVSRIVPVTSAYLRDRISSAIDFKRWTERDPASTPMSQAQEMDRTRIEICSCSQLVCHGCWRRAELARNSSDYGSDYDPRRSR